MRFLSCSLAVAALFLTAGAADAATRSWPATGFERVDLRAAADVAIRTGTGFAVQADGDPRLLELLTVDVRQGTLTIGWRDHGHPVNVHQAPHITVTLPRLAGVALSGAGAIAVDKVDAPAFAADMSGAGTIRVAQLHTGRAQLTMAGAGEIVLAGTTDQIDARVSGVGSLDATALAARAGRLTVSGTGGIKARVDGPVDASMSGIGHIEVAGHPRCTVHKSGLGSIRCG
jgi:hypothetical protein